jgi:Mn2+/Fe2+ NRAMP family transporter
LMGDYVNSPTFNVIAWVTAIAVIILTLVLVYVTIIHPGGMPGTTG